MSELTGLNIKELKKEGDKNYLIQYFFDGPMYNEQWLRERGVGTLDAALGLQRLVQHIVKHVGSASAFVARPELWLSLNADHRNVLNLDANDGVSGVYTSEKKYSETVLILVN